MLSLRRLLALGGKRRPHPLIETAHELQSLRPDKAKLNKAEFFRLVAEGPRTVTEVNREYAGLAFGTGKLTFEEYVRYRLYESGGLTLEEKKQFISENLHWKLAASVNDRVIYEALTQDKFVSYAVLSSFGFAVPKTVAVITSTPRSFPGASVIRSPEDLRSFVSSRSDPLFFKPNTGINSLAAFVCDGVGPDGTLVTRPLGIKTAEEVMTELVAGHDFLVQEVLSNHPNLHPITTALSTVRLTNFIIDGRVYRPGTIMKLTADDVIADNFWREGNMLADIDAASGRVRRVIRGHGVEMEILTEAPKSGKALIGFELPHWRETLALSDACALALWPIPFTSHDIAITEKGPVIVEVNTGGSFDLVQLATGRGLLTPEIKAFFKL